MVLILVLLLLGSCGVHWVLPFAKPIEVLLASNPIYGFVPLPRLLNSQTVSIQPSWSG